MKIYFLLIICISFVVSFYKNEKKSLAEKKINNELTNKISDKKISISYNKEKGLFCKANKIIKQGEELFRVKKDQSICSFDIFPFKFEIAELLIKIPSIVKSIGKNNFYADIMLAYHIAFLRAKDKEEIIKYIKDNNISKYYGYKEPNINLKNLPKYIENFPMFDESEDFILSEIELGFNYESSATLKNLFNQVNGSLTENKHYDIISFVNNFENFKVSYSMALALSKELTLSDYNKLTNKDVKNFNELEKLNFHSNAFWALKSPGKCLLEVVYICGHYHPKDKKSSRPMKLEVDKNDIIIKSMGNYKNNDEVSFTYNGELDNYTLVFYYGFSIRDNHFNALPINLIEDANAFDSEFKNLCAKIGGCYNSRDFEKKTLQYNIVKGSFNQNLLNIGKILFLDKTSENVVNFIKKISKKENFSTENTLFSYINYLSMMRRDQERKQVMLNRLLRRLQLTRNALNQQNQDLSMTKYKKLLKKKNLLETDLSYQSIIFNQQILIGNGSIALFKNEMAKLKNQYLGY